MEKAYINGMFLTQRKTGIQRFSHEMCRALSSMGYDITVLAPRAIRSEYEPAYKVVRFGVLKGVLWEHFALPVFLWKRHSPLLISFGSPGPLLYKNRIVTIHDVSFYFHPQWFSRLYGLYYRLATPLMARFSKKILTVSAFSKSEILRWLNIPDEKITVVHNAVSQSIIKNTKDKSVPEERYILTVCSMDPRKNLAKTIKAYKRAAIEKTIRLKAAGGGSALFKMHNTPEILDVALGYVSDQELATLYNNAELFIYASLYEGFGIPPLEAMASGCPVILSDIPVFKEIFGDAAYYVNPNDEESIARGMKKVLENPGLKKTLIERGYEKTKEYSWEKSARKLGALINQLQTT